MPEDLSSSIIEGRRDDDITSQPETSNAFGNTCSPLQNTVGHDLVAMHSRIVMGVANSDAEGVAIACTPVDAFRIGVGMQVSFEQLWVWDSQRLGPPQASLTLAPAEARTVELTTTRRRMVTDRRHSVTESIANTETSDSTRSSTNVSQTSARRRNWSVSTNGSMNIGNDEGPLGGNLDIGFDIENSLETTATLGSESAQEATRTSSEQLRSTFETTVETVTEFSQTRNEKRELLNPYRDRSLTLNFFSLNDVYRVSTAAVGNHPVLMLQLEKIVFDEQFVLSNSRFLEAVLLDQGLADELPTAIRTARRRPHEGRVDEVVVRVVGDAFDVLFRNTGIFRDFDPDGDDENAPHHFQVDSSLDAEIGPSCLGDAHNNQFARAFSAIAGVNYLRNKYRGLATPPGPGEESEITQEQLNLYELELCLALAESIQPEWRALSAAHLSNLFDNNHNTEVIRRVEAFLLVVENILRPALGDFRIRTRVVDLLNDEGDENFASILEPEVDESTREAERLIQLTVEHLKCFETYYRYAYLRDLFDATDGMVFRQWTRSQLREHGGGFQQVLALVDWSGAYVDRDVYVLPLEDGGSLEDLFDLLDEQIPGLDIDVNFERPDTPGPTAPPQHTVIIEVPNGTHIEPYAGRCGLLNVPAPVADDE